MRLSHFFIDRPIFATVLSILITLIGAVAYFTLPVAQYPEIAPPTIEVTRQLSRRLGRGGRRHRGDAARAGDQRRREHALHVVARRPATASSMITVTFALGTDLDTAQVLVQNRVAIAEPRLPEEVRRLGVTVRKNSPDLMMVIHLRRRTTARDQLYISQLRDPADPGRAGAARRRRRRARVRRARLLRCASGSTRTQVAARGLTAGDVVAALRGQNVQVASGVLEPAAGAAPGAPSSSTSRRWAGCATPRQFGNIIVKTEPGGRVTRVRDIGAGRARRPGLQRPTAISTTRRRVPLLIFQRPGSNALATAEPVMRDDGRAVAELPAGPATTTSSTTRPSSSPSRSTRSTSTIFEAVVLVVLVVILFLQTWRAAIIPIVAIPVSLIGTFAVLAAFGFSLNNLSLFGLVLAIGIVVDDAIVVVENVERNLAAGMSPRDAAHRHHGRGRRRADRDRAGAGRGVHPDRLHPAASPASSSASSR